MTMNTTSRRQEWFCRLLHSWNAWQRKSDRDGLTVTWCPLCDIVHKIEERA